MARTNQPYPAQSSVAGAANGKQIAIAATGTPGTLLHTATTGTVNWDFVTVELTNTTGADIVATFEWGGTGAADVFLRTIPAGETIVACDRRRLRNGHTVAAFASAGLNAYIEVDHWPLEPS